METITADPERTSWKDGPTFDDRGSVRRILAAFHEVLPLREKITTLLSSIPRQPDDDSPHIPDVVHTLIETIAHETSYLERLDRSLSTRGALSLLDPAVSETIEDAFAVLYCASAAVTEALYEEGSRGADTLARGLTTSIRNLDQLLRYHKVMGSM